MSARLNPELATLSLALDVAVQDEAKLNADIATLEKAYEGTFGSESDGKRRARDGGKKRGGGVLNDITLSVQAKLGVLKAVTLMGAYNAGWIVQEGVSSAAAASPVSRQDVKQYIKEQYFDPLGDVGGRLLQITLKLADQAIVKGPVTAVMLTIGSVSYTLNFTAEVFKQFNTIGRKTTESLLSDESARKAAEAAVATTKEAITTGAVVAVVANQIGLLPVSAVFAAILFSLRLNLGTGGGRAYLISGLYALYSSKDAAGKAKLKQATIEYAAAAKKAANKGTAAAVAADPSVRAAAKTLAGLLSAGGLAAAGAGSNLLNGIVAAAKNTREWVAPGRGAPGSAEPASAEAALVDGAAAAAIAVDAGGAANAADAAGAAVGAPGAPSSSGAAGDESASASASAAMVAEEDDAPEEAPPEQAKVKRRQRFDPAAKEFPGKPAGGGRRKTKKGKSKRRVTRRKKATKVMGAPVFIY